MSQANRWDPSQPVDVAVLIALEEEFRELESDLGDRWTGRLNAVYGGYDYFWEDELGYRCVATFIGEMGPQEAVRGAERLLRLEPAVLVNIGIAASLHDDVCIGDIVVPDLVQAYDKTGKAGTTKDGRGKESRDDWAWQARPDAFRPEHALVEEARHLRSAHRLAYDEWQEVGAQELAKIRESNERALEALLHKVVIRERPEIRPVALASGCFVIAARAFAQVIRKMNGDLMAAEMEAAGVMLSAAKRRGHVQALVIRGISDHIGIPKSKTDRIQKGALRGLAMRNAWRLLRIYMRLGMLPRSSRSGGEEPRVLFEGPRQAPVRSVPHFTGRADALDELERLLLRDNRTICVVATGIGGIGKTTLAEEFVATRAPKLFPAGAAWLDGGQYMQALGRVTRRFGWIDDREPSPGEALSLLGQVLHSKPILLVVDNFDPEVGDPEHVPRPGGKCRTLVTSRSRTLAARLDGASLELGVWTIEACREYLRERCPRLDVVPDNEVDALAEFVGRLPLAARLLVLLLHSRVGLGPTEALKLLEQQKLRTLDKYDRDRGIAATFQFSYDALTESGRRVLQTLAACAGQTRTAVVAAVAGTGEVGELLDDLHTRGLAEFTAGSDAPWGLHDLVRMFVLDQPGREEFEVAHTAWVRAHLQEHSEATAWESFATGVDEARRAFERLLGADLGEAMAIYQPLESHLRDAGRYPESISLSELLLGAAPVDSVVASIARNNLGLCYEAQGDISKAIDAHERSLAISERSGNFQGQAASLGNLGTCYRTKGDIPTAIDFHERALAIDEQFGIFESQANQLVNLGSCYLTRGDVPKAIGFFERALAIDEQISNPVDQAAAFGNLGLCYKIQGDISKAIDFHERSLAIHERFGRPEGQAAAIGNLGGCYQVQGDVSKAIDFFERSLAIYERVGSLEGQAIQLGNLGNCYETQGDTPTAIHFLERALAIDEQRGSLEGQATQLGNLGVCYKGQGNIPTAIDYFQRSLAISEQLGSLEGQAIALGNLGVCYERQGDISTAIDFFQRSLVANEQLGSLEGQAIQLGNLGSFVAQYGDPAQAPHYFNRAIELFRRMGLSDDHPNIVLLIRNWAALGGSVPGSALRSDDASDLADLGNMAELKKDTPKGRRKRRKKA